MGKDTSQTKSVRKFKKMLRKAGLPIVFEDERLSSVSAKNSLIFQNIKTGHNKEDIDNNTFDIVSAGLQFSFNISKHMLPL